MTAEMQLLTEIAKYNKELAEGYFGERFHVMYAGHVNDNIRVYLVDDTCRSHFIDWLAFPQWYLNSTEDMCAYMIQRIKKVFGEKLTFYQETAEIRAKGVLL